MKSKPNASNPSDSTIRRLPLFTYGTLKPSNRGSLLNGLIEGSTPANLAGFELRDAGLYPVAVPSRDEVVSGTLVWLDLHEYEKIMEILDRYEGQGFKRSAVVANVSADGCPVECWVYSCHENKKKELLSLPKVPNGFWSR
jgi:gamma-glutamylcyclotransferase (GGCT)/AIG2-like uncharacterized protein YtfP